MTLLKTSALFIGLTLLGFACSSDSSNTPDAPIVGGTGGAKTDGPLAVGTGGAGGAIVPLDSGAGGAMVVIAAASDGGSSTIDSNPNGIGGIDGSIDGGTTAQFTKSGSIAIMNTPTTGGLDVTGPATVAYATCK